MSKTVDFVNLDNKQQSVLKNELMEKLKSLKLTCEARFEQVGGAGFRGTVLASGEFGPAYVSIERKNIIDLCLCIKASIRNQLHRRSLEVVDPPVIENLVEVKTDQMSSSSLDKSPANSCRLGEKSKVLIIDDDVDALMPIYTIFNEYGCEMNRALNHLDASDQIRHEMADIIVLDWRLGRVTGGYLIERCVNLIEKSSYLNSKFLKKPVKLITYSGENYEDIQFSLNSKKYFEHIDHWGKPILFSEIQRRALSLIS